MATVRVDRYQVTCHTCGFTAEFLIGAGMGDLHAVAEAERLHGRAMLTACPTGDAELHVVVLNRA